MSTIPKREQATFVQREYPETLTMPHDEAYRKAEKKIEEALRDRAEVLDLTGYQLTSLPESLGKLTQLQALYLSANQLTTLPESLGKLTQLQILDLSENQLTSLPESLANFTQLRALHLSENQLTALPESLGKLTQLETLELQYNQLTSLPESVGKLAQLEVLSLNDNQLASLPELLEKLTKLEWLDLSTNQLTSLPEWLGQLTQLMNLHLYSNRLTSLPESLGKLTQLERLYLHENPELGIPPEILGPTWDEVATSDKEAAARQGILDYYFRIHPPQLAGSEGEYLPSPVTLPLNEAKVILVGEADVGKTSLVHQLLYNQPAEPDRGKTRGIDIHRWDVQIKDDEIRLNVWDFGGQEIMHATHQMFMTKRSVYVLVLDSRQSEEANRLNYWLKIIDSFSDGSPVIVACNHCDEEEMDLDRKQLLEKYPNIADFVMRVSCLKRREGIEEVRELIFEQVDRLEYVHDRLPAEWFEVKQRLEQWREEKEDYITLDRFREICAEQEEVDDDSQDRLLKLLHELGTVLHFPKSDGQQLSVLNPDWVTKGVYDILNSDDLFQRHARLDESLLKEILTDKAYPKDKQRFIVQMMKQFELCWEFFEAKPWRVLVPDRLGKEEPEVGEWDDALAFQFRFPVLPGSVLTRFMVRNHEWIEEELFWKHGVVLRNPNPGENNLALVRTDRDAGILHILIKGDTESRRQFLHSVRTALVTIIRDIRGLEFEQRVPLPDQREVTVSYEYLCELERDGETGEFRFEGAKKKYTVSQLLNGVEEPKTRKGRREMSKEKGSGHNFEGAHIGELHIGDDRSVGDIQAEQVQIGGDNATQKMKIELPPPSETDMAVNLEAIRKIVQELQLEEADAEYVYRQLDNAMEDVGEAEPDKDAVGKALERTTTRLEKVGKLAGATEKLKPYAAAIGGWHGEHSEPFLSALT